MHEELLYSYIEIYIMLTKTKTFINEFIILLIHFSFDIFISFDI